MKSTLILLFLLLSDYSYSQIKYDVENLKNNGNPAATLINVNSEHIQLIKEPTDFTTLLRANTDNFQKLPTNLGMEFLVFDLFSKQTRRIDTTNLDNVKENLKETFAISGAFRSKGDDQMFSSFGTRVSIFRGKYYKSNVTSIIKLMKSNNDDIARFKNKEDKNELVAIENEISQHRDELTRLKNMVRENILDTSSYRQQRDQITGKIDSLQEQKSVIKSKALNSEYVGFLYEQNKDLGQKLFTAIDDRKGFKMDVSAGYSHEFSQLSFYDNQAYRVGAWTTLSYDFIDFKKETDFEEKDGLLEFLGVGRFLHQPHLDTAGNKKANLIDGGLRLQYENRKFVAGGEYIYRHYTKEIEDFDSNQNRWVLNLGFDVGKNTLLSANFGRDFDGENLNEGNLIAAFNFITGIGKTKEAEVK